MDRIFRYEDIAIFTEFLEDRLDCAISLPRVNVPPSVDVALSPQTEAELRATMDGLREARAESEELRDYIDRIRAG